MDDKLEHALNKGAVTARVLIDDDIAPPPA